MKKEFRTSRPMELLQTLPGVGFILSVVILLETGEVSRFPGAPRLAAYSGTTPRVHASGGKVRYGQTRSDVNRYLKWAFVEAANCVALNSRHFPSRHVEPALREDTAAQRPSEGSGSGGSSSCRGHLLDIEERRALQRTSKDVGFVHERVSANFY